MLTGVSAALARRCGVDVTLIRMAFVLLSLAWGLGIAIYAGLWFWHTGADVQAWRSDAAKRANRVRARLEHLPRAMSSIRVDLGPRPSGGPASAFAACGLLLSGALVLMWSFGLFAWVTPLRAIGLAAIALGGGTLLGGLREAR